MSDDAMSHDREMPISVLLDFLIFYNSEKGHQGSCFNRNLIVNNADECVFVLFLIQKHTHRIASYRDM